MNDDRKLERPVSATPSTDGDGVRILRTLGPRGMGSLDPFLMLDELKSEPAQIAGGFPPHPHRGFETVTYMLQGGFRHEDHMGNQGVISAGGVQWMTAGRGVVHSEMPILETGELHGFQLWLNLPAAEKMRAPGWRDIEPDQVPEVSLNGGGRARIIAGTPTLDGQQLIGAADTRSTRPHYLDIRLPPDRVASFAVPGEFAGFIYVYKGSLTNALDGDEPAMRVRAQQSSRLGGGEQLTVRAGEEGVSFLLLYGKALQEPLVQQGPFVMNTAAEIDQAFRDYRAGRLAS